MAQDFVGSNNVNLLVPSGQFGTRLVGGEDAASPRYIFTHLSPVTRYLFPEDDDALLDYLEDDGQTIEPRHYCPTIPLVLVNGSQGIGTGWSTFIPSHRPLSVIDYIRRKIDGELSLPQIEPFVRGFEGIIERKDDGQGYASFGRVHELNSKTVLIDELPIGVWTSKYKAHLLKLQAKGTITDFLEDHTTTKVSFKVRLKAAELARMKKRGLEKSFKLESSLALTNMNAFDHNGQIQKFDTPEGIAEAYFPIRQSLYEDRKSVLQSTMEYSASKQRNKARFIELVSNGQIDLMGGVGNRRQPLSKEETSQLLKENSFQTSQQLEALRHNNTVHRKYQNSVSEDEEDNFDELEKEDDFDYLLQMPLSSLTQERIESLQKDATKTEAELNSIRSTQPEELWLSDLDQLAKHIHD